MPNWLSEISDEIEDLLTGDAGLIAAHCGMDTLMRLWENLPSMSLFISTKPLTEAKKRYILKKYNGSNAKELAATLNVSERFVYSVVASQKKQSS